MPLKTLFASLQLPSLLPYGKTVTQIIEQRVCLMHVSFMYKYSRYAKDKILQKCRMRKFQSKIIPT